MTNYLLEKPTALDTTKSIVALVKLGLALSGNSAAIALGTFLETMILAGLQRWEQAPTEAPEVDNGHSPPLAAQASTQGITVTEVLSYFNIRTIEISPDSLLRLLRGDVWISAKGGIYLIAPGEPVGLANWFSAQLFPEVLYNSTIFIRGDQESALLTATFPAARLPTASIHITTDKTLECILEPKLQQGAPVTFTGIYKSDVSQDLVEHGIRLAPGFAIPGFLITLRLTTHSDTSFHKYILIPDLPSLLADVI